MMYLGSLMMALAVEESGLHKRIALKALLLAGTSPSRYKVNTKLPPRLLLAGTSPSRYKANTKEATS